jgi:hypothetical protein
MAQTMRDALFGPVLDAAALPKPPGPCKLAVSKYNS